MAARACPTTWQCHKCHGGPYIIATTTHCTSVVENGITCAHKMCDECKIDKPMPSSSEIRAFERELEPQVPGAKLEDAAQIPLSNQFTSDVFSGPNRIKSDRDVAIHSLPSGSMPAISFDVSNGGFPDVDLVGYASSVSDKIIFKGKIDTGASTSIITEKVAGRLGTHRIDSNKCIILNHIGNDEIRTIGEITVRIRYGYNGKWLIVPFQVLPDSFVCAGVDALLSEKHINHVNLRAPHRDFPEKQEGIHEGSEQLDRESIGVAAMREGLDEDTTDWDEDTTGWDEDTAGWDEDNTGRDEDNTVMDDNTTGRDEKQEDLFGEYEIRSVTGRRPSPVPERATAAAQDTADALSYLDGVKERCIDDDANQYTQLLSIMKDFENQEIDTPGVVEQVSNLFNGNSAVARNLNSFIAPGYRIESGTDKNPDTIRIITPDRTSTMTQSCQHRPHGLLETTIGHQSQNRLEDRPGWTQPQPRLFRDGVSTSFPMCKSNVLSEGNKGLNKEHEGQSKEQEGLTEQNERLEDENENKLNEATSTMVTEVSEASLKEAKIWEERVHRAREESVCSSTPELNQLIFPAISADPKSPRDIDLDEESMAKSIFSANSEGTITTGTDISGESEEGTAAHMYFQFIINDDLLGPLFEEAREQSKLPAKHFEATMRVLLKKFARELRPEAKSEIQRKAIPFLSQRAGFVARGLTRIYYWQDEASDLSLVQQSAGQSGFVTNQHLLEKGEDGDEDDDEVSTAQSEFHILFSSVREFLLFSTAFTKLRETLRRLLNPEQPSWDTIRDQWQRELCLDFPVDLQQACSIEILVEDQITWADKFKSALEDYSGEEWLWAPFRAPRRSIPEGQVRIQWKCSCESIQWEDVSPGLAQKAQIMHRIEGSRPQAGIPSGQSSQAPTSVTGLSDNTITGDGVYFDRLTSNQGGIYTAGGPDTSTGRLSTRTPSSQYSCRMLFVLLCVPYGWFGIPELRSSVIQISESQDDDTFFREFRKHYRSLRGFMHSWFDIRDFSFCHAARFEKWDLDSLGWSCDEMPPDKDVYEYVPQPAPKPYAGLLTRHEWGHRFYRLARTRGLRNAFQKIPKRTCPFQISTDASREYVWGLHAQLRLSAKRLLMWTSLIVFIITFGGWIFMKRWLSHHSEDLQNAAVPVTLVMMTWGLLCLPLSWVINKDT